jgi:acetamidase/formamidase
VKAWASALAAPLVIVGCSIAEGTPSTMHDLVAAPGTVHRNFFDATLPPVLTIASGDFVHLATATGNPRYFEELGVPKEKIPAELFAAFEGVEGSGRGDHTLNGPIYVTGAEPGDMLEVRILSVDVRLPIAGQGFSPNRGTLPGEFAEGVQRPLFPDLEKRVTEYAPGVVVRSIPSGA